MFRAWANLVVMLGVNIVHAQEQFGLTHSNYAGTDALPLNPARMATQWCWTDINILGAGAFVWNDHVYISGKDRSIIGEMRESIRTEDGDRFNINESLHGGDRQAFVQEHVVLPAVAMTLGLNSFGAHISLRGATSITGVGQELARFAYNGLTYTPQHGERYEDDHLRIATAAWTEIGASYARLLIARDNTLLSAGITPKYLLAHGGAGLTFSAFSYTVLDTAQAVVYEASGVFGLAPPAMNAGRGFGVDIGAVYERTLENADGYIPHSSCDPLPYRYRLGVSLIDLGGMRFKQGMSGRFDASTAFYPDYTGIDIDSEEDVDSLLSASLTTFERSSAFKMGLPTAIAVQFDQRLAEHVYVAADVVQNLTFGHQLRLRRPNSVAVVPRFEMQRVELALPVVLNEYDIRHPSFGLMLRLNSIAVGSDNLFPLVTRGNLFGTDVWFRVKWTIFRSPECRGRKSRKHRAGDTSALPCTLPN